MDDSSEPLAMWCESEEWCPVTATATLIGNKWHTVIVDRLLKKGPLGFSALGETIGGISSKVLSENLEEMTEKGLLDRAVISDRPFRVEYSLTERGASLEPIIVEMRAWGTTHLVAADSPRHRE